MVENKYTLKFTQKAYKDLDGIYDYISKDLYNPSAADNLLQHIETNIISLQKFPFSGSFVRDEILKNKGHRKLLVQNYIVFYLVRKEISQVVVMRILYSKQKYQDYI